MSLTVTGVKQSQSLAGVPIRSRYELVLPQWYASNRVSGIVVRATAGAAPVVRIASSASCKQPRF